MATNRTPNHWNDKGKEPEVIHHAGISSLPIIAIWRTEDGTPVTIKEFNEQVGQRFLAGEYLTLLNDQIRRNADILPAKTKGKKSHQASSRGAQDSECTISSFWARKHIESDPTLVPASWIEKFWTVTAAKCETARLLQPHRARVLLYQATHDADGNPLPKEQQPKGIVEALDDGSDYVDTEWVRNIMRMCKQPRVPIVKNPVLPLSQMSPQVGQMIAFRDVIYLHRVALGDDRYEIKLDARLINKRHEMAEAVSLPNVRWDSESEVVCFDVDTQEGITRRAVKSNHLVAFDRNADHDEAIAGVRVCSNGQVSKVLGLSVQTQATIRHLNRLREELARLDAAVARLMPNPRSRRARERRERVVAERDAVRARVDVLKAAVDQLEAEDMMRHLRAGEALAVEQLRYFGGYGGFRHGETTDALEQKAEECGVALLKVNPAHTSDRCMCGATVTEHGDHTVSCDDDGHGERFDRHVSAAGKIGTRGLRALGYGVPDSGFVGAVDAVASVGVVGARSARKVAKRERKRVSRASRGKRTPSSKSRATPSRPSSRRVVDDVAGRVGAARARRSGELAAFRAVVLDSGGEVNAADDDALLGPCCSQVPRFVLPVGNWSKKSLRVSALDGEDACNALIVDLQQRPKPRRKRQGQGTTDRSCHAKNTGNSTKYPEKG